MFQDAGGIRSELRNLADAVAATGLVVRMPNLFYRHGPFAPFDMRTVFSVPSERDRLMGLARSVTTQTAMADVRALLDDADKTPGITAHVAGAFGYCLGGRVAFLAAGYFPQRIQAAASIHGGYLVTAAPDSPHQLTPQIKAKLYFAVADNDNTCTQANVSELRQALDGAGVTYALDFFANRAHGFAVPGTAAFDADASEQHLRRLHQLFETLA